MLKYLWMVVNKMKFLGRFIVFIAMFYGFAALCDHQSPSVPTNRNEKDNFLENSVPDHNALKRMLESHKNDYGAEINGASGLGGVIDFSEPKISREVRDLKDGNKKISAQEEAEAMSMHVDLTDPLLQRDKSDLEKISEDSSKSLGSLISDLRDIGVDCREGGTMEVVDPAYSVEKINMTYRNKLYDKALCEQLRNKYDCRDVLNIRCKDPHFVHGALKNVTSNIVHSIDGNGTFLIGLNQEKSFYHTWGAQGDFEISFDVDDPAAVDSFKLLDVYWADYVLIKLNDNIIFQGPNTVSGKIEISTNPAHFRTAINGERFYGVDIGIGDYVCVNTRGYSEGHPNYEAKQFLKRGKNSLKIRLAYGNGGKIYAVLKYREKRCTRWEESWSEQCVLK